jgi:hypothetical protein
MIVCIFEFRMQVGWQQSFIDSARLAGVNPELLGNRRQIGGVLVDAVQLELQAHSELNLGRSSDSSRSYGYSGDLPRPAPEPSALTSFCH